MRVLAFRHVPFEHLGRIGESLESAGIAFEYVDLPAGPPPAIPLERAGGLVFMGGPMSANDDLPCIHRELEIIRQAVAAGQPVLGICLGAQLIAKALGARVYRNAVKEIGWFPVEWTAAGRRDPLLTGLTGPETVFHWHGETFDLPRGAEWLAQSDRCRHQAFRAGAGVYGFQFHLEVTPEMIADWLTQDLNKGDAGELAPPPDQRVSAARLAELSSLVFGRWAKLVADRSAETLR
jgi:GMP synthase-like glutamine amidotransferase